MAFKFAQSSVRVSEYLDTLLVGALISHVYSNYSIAVLPKLTHKLIVVTQLTIYGNLGTESFLKVTNKTQSQAPTLSESRWLRSTPIQNSRRTPVTKNPNPCPCPCPGPS